jgi:hypothetical protein
LTFIEQKQKQTETQIRVVSQFIFHEPSAKGKVGKPYYVIKKLLARSTPVIQSDLTPLPARNQKN